MYKPKKEVQNEAELPDMFGRNIKKRFDLTDFQSQVKYFTNLEKKK